MIPRLREAAELHSLIFYAAGYSTARVVPGYRPYADAPWVGGRAAGTPALGPIPTALLGH